MVSLDLPTSWVMATNNADEFTSRIFEAINGMLLDMLAAVARKDYDDRRRRQAQGIAKMKANGGVGLFYYAGHGIQVGGRNYLIPVDADIPREDEIEDSAVNLDLVLRKLDTANNGLNIVILDACRNNPFARSWTRGEDAGGLAQISAPTGTFIAYATSPDRTASDGEGHNGLYTSQMLRALKVPNLKIEANDVRCSHASAVGPIDDDQRYYLESRGIPPEEAERLIVLGFFDDVFGRLPVPALVGPLRRTVVEKIEHRGDQ